MAGTASSDAAEAGARTSPAAAPEQRTSVFFPPRVRRRAAENAARYPWAAEARRAMIDAASSWLAMSDEALWSLMFGPTLPRSWHVWSNGHCPACRGDVPMYNWRIDPLREPWKLACPHCHELFPKNDFAAFHRSGLDERGVFDPARADRALLFNAEHPEPADPLHRFGVDDGHGCIDGDRRWRFVAAYLVHGQWKQAVVGGINALAAAHLASGEVVYAHKAGVLLHRVAELYPGFDYIRQGWLYERSASELGCNGYVSVWHDACEETRELILAYDYVRQALHADADLAGFLGERTSHRAAEAPPLTPARVCRDIEDGIVRDAIRNSRRIHSNYPRREIALAIAHACLGWDVQREEVRGILDTALERATAVDGVTGEKGLSAYSAYAIQGLAVLLAQLERVEPGTLRDLLRRHPRLALTYRFHIDTWCLRRYYPTCGDAGWFAGRHEHYVGASFHKRPSVHPSMFEFFWKLFDATGDPAYVQVLHHENGGGLDGLPHDLFADDPEALRRGAAEVIAAHGPEPQLGSVLKDEWKLAILRSGRGADARAVWLDFDAGGGHGHSDGMNLGLYAKGLDLMPDLGYPPVQFGGWNAPRAAWYASTLSHNTVVVDGKTQGNLWQGAIGGRCTLWADGRDFAAVRASGPEMVGPPAPSGEVELSGVGHDRIGVELRGRATVRCVRVWTRPEPAVQKREALGALGASSPLDGEGGDARDGRTAEEDGWTLAFVDRFDRDALGGDWRPLGGGPWEPARPGFTGSGALVCTRPFAGCQRVEVEIESTSDPLPTVGVALGVDQTNFLRGVVFFWSAQEGTSSMYLHGSLSRTVAAPAASDLGAGPASQSGRTDPRRCTIVGERDGTTLAHAIDGRLVQSHVNTAEGARRVREKVLRGWQYERTVVRIDVDERDAYCLDVFRVAGGREHTKLVHSHFGRLTTHGLRLTPGQPWGDGEHMRAFRTDPAAAPGWSADWAVEDRYGFLPPGADVHLRYVDLTGGTTAVSTCEGWVMQGLYDAGAEEAWIPRLVVRRGRGLDGDSLDSDGRTNAEPLASTFVAVIEPYEGASRLASARRLTLQTPGGERYPEGFVAVEVRLADGRTDVLIAAEVESPSGPRPGLPGAPGAPGAPGEAIVQAEWRIELDGELAHVRFGPDGRPEAAHLARGRRLRVGGVELTDGKWADFSTLGFPRR